MAKISGRITQRCLVCLRANRLAAARWTLRLWPIAIVPHWPSGSNVETYGLSSLPCLSYFFNDEHIVVCPRYLLNPDNHKLPRVSINERLHLVLQPHFLQILDRVSR